MKHSLLSVIITCATLFSYGQDHSLTIDASQMVSTFSFTNSDGIDQNADYQSILTASYGVGYRYISKSGIVLRAGFGRRDGGANSVYDETNNSWRLEYIDSKLGFGYLFDLGRFNPYIVASGYYAYLLRGIQTLNNEALNITESGLLKSSDFGVIGDIGVNVKITDRVSVYVEGEYLYGMENIEKDADQTSENRSYAIKLGLSFNLSSREKNL